MPDESIREWLGHTIEFMMARNPVSSRLYSFVLENGRSFSEDDGSREKFTGVRRQPMHCYENSQRLALKKQLRYFEGWAIPRIAKEIGLPMQHAWCVSGDKVVDITWRDGVSEYFGLEIPSEYLKKRCSDRSCLGSELLIDYFLEIGDTEKTTKTTHL